MSTEHAGSGWLPAEAHELLGEQQARASADAAAALLALAPRGRVLALLRRATMPADVEDRLEPADFARVLASFAGEETLAAEALCREFPELLMRKSAR